MRSADTESKELKNDLVNEEVVSFSVTLNSSLNVISNIYSNDSIIDQIPEQLTCVLNKLYACFKVNEDLKQSLIDLSEENFFLSKRLNAENKNKMVLEESIGYEDDFRKEFERVNANFLKLDGKTQNLINQVKSKNEII